MRRGGLTGSRGALVVSVFLPTEGFRDQIHNADLGYELLLLLVLK